MWSVTNTVFNMLTFRAGVVDPDHPLDGWGIWRVTAKPTEVHVNVPMPQLSLGTCTVCMHIFYVVTIVGYS